MIITHSQEVTLAIAARQACRARNSGIVIRGGYRVKLIWPERLDSDGPDPIFFRGGVRQAISTLRFYRKPNVFGPDHPCTIAVQDTMLSWWRRYRVHMQLAHRRPRKARRAA